MKHEGVPGFFYQYLAPNFPPTDVSMDLPSSPLIFLDCDAKRLKKTPQNNQHSVGDYKLARVPAG